MEVALSIKDITVRFGGFKAIDQLTLDIKRGGLRFIIGPNGAGKTTLLDVICGKVSPQMGLVTCHVEGEEIPVSTKKIEQIVGLGIARKFQAPSIFENLTVLENLELAIHAQRCFFIQLLRSSDSAKEKQRMDEVLEMTGLTEVMYQTSGMLPHGKKQWLEIAMTLVSDPKIVLIDEPIAGMSSKERDATGELLKKIGEKATVVIVEHDMNFVGKYADEVIVMHRGKLLSSGTFQEINNNPHVIDVYLGR